MTRILGVEDEPDPAFGLEDDLKVEGYEVAVARDGAAAVRRALEEPWDLILLDVMLPQKDGFEVCRALRRAGIGVPIIMLCTVSPSGSKTPRRTLPSISGIGAQRRLRPSF